jgi:hypothetical protein
LVAGDLVAFRVPEAAQGGIDLNSDGDASDQVLQVFDAGTGISTNLGLAADDFLLEGGLAAFRVRESSQGDTDLNGDGDASDRVVHVFDAAAGITTNLGLAAWAVTGVEGDLVAFPVMESSQGRSDLNGDGDAVDFVAHVFSATTGTTRNLGLATESRFAVEGNIVAFRVWERGQGSTDLNGDGDTSDFILHVARIGPTAVAVDVDVKPGSDPNSTNIGSRGVIPVAILTTSDFDAADVDPDTVLFEGASPVHYAPEDVDVDGDLDLIMHFRTQETDIAEDAMEACLTGETFSGQPVQGCDVIRIVPPSLDSDGDGFGDAVEATLVTDQFAACPTTPAHDAWPPDADMDTDVDIGDVISLLNGIMLNSANYQMRSDFDADGDVDIGDAIAGFLGKIFTSCG